MAHGEDCQVDRSGSRVISLRGDMCQFIGGLRWNPRLSHCANSDEYRPVLLAQESVWCKTENVELVLKLPG